LGDLRKWGSGVYLYKDFQLTYVEWRMDVRDIMSGLIVKIVVDERVTNLIVENSGDTVNEDGRGDGWFGLE